MTTMDASDYYFSVAPRSSLCCITCTVDPNEIRDSSAKSYFHWKTLKCRLVVNMMPSVIIATPTSRVKGSFFVVTTNEYYKSGQLQDIFKTLNLTYSGQQPVTAATYVDCIRYTSEFYTSPLWNRVNHVYMEGRDFLKNSEFNHAIIQSISMVSHEASCEDEIRIRLTPVAVKLPPMKLEHLAIPSAMIAKFWQEPYGVLDVSLFGVQRVIVLPSMRRGIVTRVLKSIPAYCPFKNYSEIRRHWKNMYGYRLPKTDDGIVWYEIHFPIPNIKAESFIYPDICIKHEMTQIPSRNPEALKKRYLQDLCSSVPQILGRQLEIFERPQHSHPGNIENASFVSADLATPRGAGCGHNPDTTRLSFSGGQPLEEKQTTTQMSPTPSLKGKRVGDKKLNFENLKKPVRNAANPVKVFLNELERSQYFRNLSATAQKRKAVNIFTPCKRPKEDSLGLVNKIAEADS